MSVTQLPFQLDHEKIAAFCRARGIRRLSLFGSVLRNDFDPVRSDVDVLAEFEPDALKEIGFRYFGYGEELSVIIGRKVDFCSRLNKYVEAGMRHEALTIYERPFDGRDGSPSRLRSPPRGDPTSKLDARNPGTVPSLHSADYPPN